MTATTYRVRAARSTDSNPADHIFVEISPSRWVEFDRVPTAAEIEGFLAAEITSNRYHLGYATRSFAFQITEWRDLAPIIAGT